MSTITLHNETENQLSLIENLLEELKIRFDISKEIEMEELTDWQKESIERGIDDFENARFTTSEEVRKGARLCLK
ncbi:hypothetical protein [Frigoriflavimonas asaccharolytica]|uniref:Putative transcriptional regulator n=1 Tax=Frigoriflavimonas asaccharolytica TaxID=2735899 RepID=A0A8J8GCB3_9FLAO|nr:hypothetical protein [Frigoriflavimonas asaccharolytica]NRS93325.1 putative transcriptional regulator [Frigoriflavimonas asaccharolytica]